LAPTVGPAAKSVIIKGEALEGMKNLVVGRIIINIEGEPIVDDSRWGQSRICLNQVMLFQLARLKFLLV
jgi:hypothetical protein